jgi:hypothetical protein
MGRLPITSKVIALGRQSGILKMSGSREMSDGDSSTNVYNAEIPFLFYKSSYTIQTLPVSYDSNISGFAVCKIL